MPAWALNTDYLNVESLFNGCGNHEHRLMTLISLIIS